MKKKIILIVITCLIIFGVILITTIKPKKEYKLKRNDALAIMVYDESLEDYIPSSTFPIGNYDIDYERSYCENGSTITGYNRETGTVTATMKAADECYLYFKIVTAANIIADLAGTTGTDGSGNAWGVIEDHGIRYVGQNPSNFVWFNCSNLTNQNENTCERWRIIGVFNEKYDTNNDGVPDTEADLIKIIRNNSLGNYSWDYKQSGVGSSTSDYGSNDWSDSQLMMMLNPPEFIHSGYATESSTTPYHSNTINAEGYVVSGGIKIFKNMGSYFDANKTAYKPYPTYSCGYSYNSSCNSVSETNLVAPSTFKRMNPLSQSMIATVKWYLRGAGSSNVIMDDYYNIERHGDGTYVYDGPDLWYGKVGLIYPSDLGYATNGNPSYADYTREYCLNIRFPMWGQLCTDYSWLIYDNSTSDSPGTKDDQWTITRYLNQTYVNHAGYYYISGYGSYYGLFYNNASGSYAVKPTLYLEPNVSITGGTGTYSDPYSLSLT